MQHFARDPRLQQILDRASTDPTFRQRLLTTPHDAVRDAFGIDIPRSFRIRFIEKDPADDALIVLPGAARRAAPASAGELDDAQLESVAGGWDPGSQWTTSATDDDWAGWR